MDKEYFLNGAIPPSQPLEFQSTVPYNGLSIPTEQALIDSNWHKSPMDQYTPFDSALSSMVSSPTASNSCLSNDTFMLTELIGKLGGMRNSGDLSPAFHHPGNAMTSSPYNGTNNNSTNDSCYSTPLNSPSKLLFPVLDQALNLPNLGNSTPPLPSLSADPGFAERAAKFSCFGSRSFNGRTDPFGLNNAELLHRSNDPLMGNVKFSRVSSSPSLKQAGSLGENKSSNPAQVEVSGAGNGLTLGSDKRMSKLPGSGANSNESSVSEQIQSGETGPKPQNELSSKKRKGGSRGKFKEDASASAKGSEANQEANAKRSKTTEASKDGEGDVKMEEETKGAEREETEKQKTNQKPPEPPKDYIHVRARRGQATDSHSLAERVRREKISERMKLLQDLVPGCNKVTGKALMLDEIINYVQSLQRQVEFLSMKLASVNPGLDVSMDNLLPKDMLEQNVALPQQLYPMDSSTSAFYSHQNVQMHNGNVVSSGPWSQCHVDPLCRNQGIQLDGSGESHPQFSAFGEGDLHSIVQTGFSENLIKDVFHSQNFPVSNKPPHMKFEL